MPLVPGLTRVSRNSKKGWFPCAAWEPPPLHPLYFKGYAFPRSAWERVVESFATPSGAWE